MIGWRGRADIKCVACSNHVPHFAFLMPLVTVFELKLARKPFPSPFTHTFYSQSTVQGAFGRLIQGSNIGGGLCTGAAVSVYALSFCAVLFV